LIPNKSAASFLSPFELANDLILSGNVDRNIPAIKERIIEVLSKEYETNEEAEKYIVNTLTNHYQNKHSDFYIQNEKSIKKAIQNISRTYKEHFFPHMKARWKMYPENIGHVISPGCFRCHDGKHESEDKKVIPRDCTICHTIVQQGPEGAIEQNRDGLSFKHPFFEFGRWKEMDCTHCHTGGVN